jgi:hypothetical protein
MAHECVDCSDECECIEGDIVERNCIGCGCDFADDDDEDEDEAEY